MTPEVAGRLARNTQYIAFGNWRLGRENPWKSPSDYEIVYQDVTLNVQRLAQIAPIAVPGEAENV